MGRRSEPKGRHGDNFEIIEPSDWMETNNLGNRAMIDYVNEPLIVMCLLLRCDPRQLFRVITRKTMHRLAQPISK
jgi:hypothetical protein